MNLAVKTDNIVIAYRPKSKGFVPERDFSDRDFPTGTRSGAMDNDFCDFSHYFSKVSDYGTKIRTFPVRKGAIMQNIALKFYLTTSIPTCSIP